MTGCSGAIFAGLHLREAQGTSAENTGSVSAIAGGVGKAGSHKALLP